MNDQELLAALQAPFYPEEIEWRLRSAGIEQGKPWVKIHAYITNRAIMNRLDHTVGPFNWRNEFIKWGDHTMLCGLSLRINREWLTKWDGAAETELAAAKGGFSESMKRAAIQWGMGRYLYNQPDQFAVCSLERQTDDAWHRARTGRGQILYWRNPGLTRHLALAAQ